MGLLFFLCSWCEVVIDHIEDAALYLLAVSATWRVNVDALSLDSAFLWLLCLQTKLWYLSAVSGAKFVLNGVKAGVVEVTTRHFGARSQFRNQAMRKLDWFEISPEQLLQVFSRFVLLFGVKFLDFAHRINLFVEIDQKSVDPVCILEVCVRLNEVFGQLKSPELVEPVLADPVSDLAELCGQ